MLGESEDVKCCHQAKAEFIAECFNRDELTVAELVEERWSEIPGVLRDGSALAEAQWDPDWKRLVCLKDGLKVIPLSPGERMTWNNIIQQNVILAIFVDTKKSAGILGLDDIEFYSLERLSHIPGRHYGPDGTITLDRPEIPWREA